MNAPVMPHAASKPCARVLVSQQRVSLTSSRTCVQVTRGFDACSQFRLSGTGTTQGFTPCTHSPSPSPTPQKHCAAQVINIADTTAVAMLGAGGFGQVLLVKYQDQFTALKCISKAFVREQVGAG